MKRITLFLAGLAAMASSVFAGGNYSYDLLGVPFKVDTLFHAKVGPGTTQTSLLFTGATYDIRVFYLTVDLETPTVTIRSVSGKDKYAGAETTSEMAIRHSKEGEQYFCGVNGDFWETGGTTVRGESRVGSPISASIIDGEIFKTSEWSVQFAIDENNVPHIGRASFNNNTATCGDKVTAFRVVNGDATGDGISLYTHRYFAGTNQQQAGSSEVQVRLADGETFRAGYPAKFVVTGAPSTAGDMDIPADGFVLHGCGTTTGNGNTGGCDFVNNLKAGDEVTLTCNVTMDGVTVVPRQMISGSGTITANGVTLPDDGSVHPRTALGYGNGGKTMIMLVADGRSSISNGARTGQLSDMMRYAGATDAINVDGGGSSCCYTQALGVRNKPSDGKERADANAIFAVCSAPTDTEVAEIRFVDWAMQLPKYGYYQPKFYGFNKYGYMVDTDLKGVTLSCPAELGTISDDGTTFSGSGEGCYPLTATYNGVTTSIPITIVPASEMKMAHDSVINDGYRDYLIEVLSKVNEDYMRIDPAALTWSSDDASIVEVGAESGVLKGVADGSTYVRGKLNDLDVNLKVVVEKPTAHAMPIDPNTDPASWTIAQVGGTGGKIEPLGDGLRYTYTGKSGRGPYIKLTKPLKMWSLPDTLHMAVNPGEAAVKSITFAMSSANGVKENLQFTPTFEAGKTCDIKIAMDSWCDPADIGSFPITIDYIYISMGTSTTGKAYTIDIPNFDGIYTAFSGSVLVEDIQAESGMALTKNVISVGEDLAIRFANQGTANIAIYNAAGQKLGATTLAAIQGTANVAASHLLPGIYFVSMTQNGNICTARFVVK